MTYCIQQLEAVPGLFSPLQVSHSVGALCVCGVQLGYAIGYQLYVQLWNFISQFWSSKGNQVMSILQVDMKMPGGMYVQSPSLVTTTFVG